MKLVQRVEALERDISEIKKAAQQQAAIDANVESILQNAFASHSQSLSEIETHVQDKLKQTSSLTR